MAREALLKRVPIPQAQIHPMLCGPSPEAAALAYEKTLRSHFVGRPPRFDLIFLGLGVDGHTASLFPGEARLLEGERWVAAVHPPGRDLPRITLTPVIINQARVVAFLVAGADKAAILKKTLQGPGEPRRLPAQLIKPLTGEIYWLVDQSAADF
jgi:6-phosphogluconolactonase